MPDVVERERLAREADHAATLAESLDRHGTTLEQQSQTYAEWYAATAMTRALGEASAQYLAEQQASDEPEPAVSAQEWLALDRATRQEDDAHRDITDIDVDERPSSEEQTSEADAEDPDRSSELDRSKDDGRAAAPEADDSNREDMPVAKTDVADIRETAAAVCTETEPAAVTAMLSLFQRFILDVTIDMVRLVKVQWLSRAASLVKAAVQPASAPARPGVG